MRYLRTNHTPLLNQVCPKIHWNKVMENDLLLESDSHVNCIPLQTNIVQYEI